MIFFKQSMLGLVAVVAGFVLIGYADGTYDHRSQYAIKNINKHLAREQDACPKGNYYDPESSRCRSFLGGGKVVHIDHYKRCSNSYLGLRVHPLYHQYYYICKKDSVVFGKCPTDQIFNSTIRHCVNPFVTNESNEDKSSNFKNSGEHPVTNCSLFYVCKGDGQNYFKKLLRCPGNNKTPKDRFDDFDINIFPKCKCPGRFRSPADCSLYYTCSAKTNGKFYQTRYRCPSGTLYDMGKEKCLRKHHVKCQYIPIEESIEQCAKYSSGDDSGEVEDSDASLDSGEEIFETTTAIPSTTTSTENLTATIPSTLHTTENLSSEEITSVLTTTGYHITSSKSPMITPDEYEGSSSDYFSGEQTDYPSLADISEESSSTITINATGDDEITESATTPLQSPDLSPNNFDTTYDSTEQNVSNLESTTPVDLNPEEQNSTGRSDIEPTTIIDQNLSSIWNGDTSPTTDVEFTTTTTDIDLLTSNFEETSTTEQNEIDYTTLTDIATVESTTASTITEPITMETLDFFTTKELPESTSEFEITKFESTEKYDTTLFVDSIKSTTNLETPDHGSVESSSPNDLYTTKTAFIDEINSTTNKYESSSNPDIYSTTPSEPLISISTLEPFTESGTNSHDSFTTENELEYSTASTESSNQDFTPPDENSATSNQNQQTTEDSYTKSQHVEPSSLSTVDVETDSSENLGMTPTEFSPETLMNITTLESITESDLDYYYYSSTDKMTNTTEDFSTENEYSTEFSEKSTESSHEITIPDEYDENSTFPNENKPTVTDGYSFTTELTVSESGSHPTFNAETTEFLPSLPTDSSEISATIPTGSSLIKEDHSTQTYTDETDIGLEEDDDDSYEETTIYPNFFTTSAPIVSEITTHDSEQSSNQPSTIVTHIENPYKNTTFVTNDNSSSFYHFEDKSFETVNLDISKPIKLLLNINPKNNCKGCSNIEGNASPLTNTTSRSSNEKSLYLHF